MLPVAPAGTGQPPSSPKLDSKLSTPASQRGEHVGQALPARVVEVRGQLHARRRARSRAAAKNSRDLARVGHAGRVAEADLLRAGVAQARGDVEHALGRHGALVRAAERGRDDALAAQPLLARAAPARARSPASDSAIERLTLLRLCVSDADRKTLISSMRSRWRERRVQPALVGHSTLTDDLVGHVDARQHLGGVGELRDHVGAHEARHLEAAQAGARERVDQLDLVARWRSSRARSGSRRAGRPR